MRSIILLLAFCFASGGMQSPLHAAANSHPRNTHLVKKHKAKKRKGSKAKRRSHRS